MSETSELMLKFITAEFPEEVDRDVLSKTLGVSARQIGINARHLSNAGEITIFEDNGKTSYLAVRSTILPEEQAEHRVGTVSIDPETGEHVMAPDFIGDKELRWKPEVVSEKVDVIDPEVAAIQICVEALESFDKKTCARVIGYLGWRFTKEEE